MAKPKLSPAEIEALYDSGKNRLTQERNDFLLPQILDFVTNRRWMNLRPEYQRRLVWSKKKKSLFIESLLMNIPVPPVFLYETDLSRYEVMDGQQRLNAIVEFYNNELKLSGLQIWSSLNGMTYKTCPPRIKSGLDRRRISANVLLVESVTETADINFTKQTVFERLNTGGQELNAQEMRNSLYSGTFNELIIKLAGNRLFNTIWGIPPYADHYREKDGYISAELAANRMFQRMVDCELILRFFAFRHFSSIKGSVKSMLDNCMSNNRNASPDQIAKWKEEFETSLNVCYEIFGERTFQIEDEKGKWRHSHPLFDAVMIAADVHRDHSSKLIARKEKVIAALNKQKKIPEKYDVIVGKKNTAAAIKERITIILEIFSKVANV